MRKINLAETVFDLEAIDKHIVGAGILPFCRDPAGSIQFGLAKERYIAHWRGSDKWSGFEGGRKRSEPVEETAAREFVEESMGILVDHAGQQLNHVPELVQRLQCGKYAARIVLCIVHPGHADRYHVTFLLEVPYQPSSMARFAAARRFMLDLQTRTHDLYKTQAALPLQSPFFREGMSIGQESVVTAVSNVEFDAGEGEDVGEGCSLTNRAASSNATLALPPECVTLGGCTPDKAAAPSSDSGLCSLRVTVRTQSAAETGSSCTCSQVFTPPLGEAPMCRAYVDWFRTRQALCADLQLCEVGVRPCDEPRAVQGMAVCDDYLEKQHLAWWSGTDVQLVLQNGGKLHSEHFRTYFLPVLQRSLAFIDSTRAPSCG